jgi:hypothetical protein
MNYDFSSYDTPATAWRWEHRLTEAKAQRDVAREVWVKYEQLVRQLKQNPPLVAARTRLDRLLAQEIGL